MEEEVEEEGQTVIIVDIAGGYDVVGRQGDVFGKIENEAVSLFENRRMIQSDQTLLGFDVL